MYIIYTFTRLYLDIDHIFAGLSPCDQVRVVGVRYDSRAVAEVCPVVVGHTLGANIFRAVVSVTHGLVDERLCVYV
jgi:hypothetical protein